MSLAYLRDLNVYGIKVRRCKNQFACPDCKTLLLPKDYEKHCSTCHKINSKRTCVWCRKVSWDKGQKYQYACHLQICFQDFMLLNKKPFKSSLNLQEYKLLDLEHTFPEKTLFDFPSLPIDEDSLWPLDDLWPLEVDPPPVEFKDDNLNLACSYVVKFHQLRDTHVWFHVMIRVVAFYNFVYELQKERGKIQTLLFSCWCNGGKHAKAEYRQHRHLIVVSPKGYFEKFWSNVKMPSNVHRPHNFKCKKSKEIVSSMHFVNTLGYLSNRKSRCDFSFKYIDSKRTTKKMNHFYLYKTLPHWHKLPLTLLWNDGIYTLLYQEKLQNISIPLLVEHPLTFVESQWKQKLKDFYGLERKLVLPVSKRFVATKQVTPVYLYLMNGQKLYFESCAENESLDDKTWLEKQVNGGNCFYEIVEEEMWVPRPKDQKFLNIHLPVVRRNEQLESENVTLKRKLEDANTKIEAKRIKIDNLSEENVSKQIKIDNLSEENKSKQIKIDTLYEENRQLMLEIKQLHREEIARLKAEIKHLSEENATLNAEIAILKAEIAILKVENVKLKAENVKLKAENVKLKTENATLKAEKLKFGKKRLTD